MSAEREPTRTELLLTNLLDNPEDDLARGVFADYVTEYDVDNKPMVAKANLIYAHQHHGPDLAHSTLRPHAEIEKALQNPALDFGLGRRVDGQVQALRCSVYGCCNRHADQQYCRCYFDSVKADLRLGFVDALHLEFMEALTSDILTDAFRHNPLKRLVLTDAALEVEIDRWFETGGPDGGDGWQVCFYNNGLSSPRTSVYFHVESFEFRREVLDNITDLVRNCVLTRTMMGANPAMPWTRPLTAEQIRLMRDLTRAPARRRRGQV